MLFTDSGFRKKEPTAPCARRRLRPHTSQRKNIRIILRVYASVSSSPGPGKSAKRRVAMLAPGALGWLFICDSNCSIRRVDGSFSDRGCTLFCLKEHLDGGGDGRDTLFFWSISMDRLNRAVKQDQAKYFFRRQSLNLLSEATR